VSVRYALAVFSTLNFYVRAQVKCAGGRVDMVVWMPDTVYVFEMKVRGTAQEALQQIDDHGYAIPLRGRQPPCGEGRRAVQRRHPNPGGVGRRRIA